MQRYISITLLLFFFQIGFSQTAKIIVLDKKNNNPIEFAHIFFNVSKGKSQLLVITDKNGEAVISLNKPTPISVSFVGYETVVDTLYPEKNKTFYLDEGVFSLKDIVITGSLFPEDKKESMLSISSLNLEKKPTEALNLNQLLNNELSIRLSQDMVLGSSLSINGLSGENIQILIDGVPLIGRLDGNIDLAQLRLSNIEKVEIIEGPMSDIFGSNSLGGVINLISSMPELNKLSSGFGTSYESVGVYDFNVFTKFKKEKIGVSFNGDRYFFDGYSELDTSRYKDWKMKEQYSTQLKLDGRKGNLDLGSNTSFFHELLKDKGNPRAPYFESAFDTYFNTLRFSNSFYLNGLLKEDLLLDFLLGYSFYNRNKNTYLRDLVNLTDVLTQDETHQDTTTFQSIISRSFLNYKFSTKLKGTIGYDFSYTTAKGSNLIGEHNMTDIALFISGKYSLNSFTLQPGVRYNYNSLYSSPIIPSLHIKYDVLSNIQLRLSLSKGFRSPSLKEQYLEFVDASHNVHGNDSLKAEESKHLNFSATYFKEDNNKLIELYVKGFYNNIDNKIALREDNPGYYTYINVEKLKTYGTSLEFKYSIHPHYSIKTGYLLTWVEDDFYGEVAFVPAFNMVFDYWRTSKRFNFSISYKYNGEWEQFVRSDVGGVQKETMSAYSWMDIQVYQKLWKDKLTIGGGVKNLFNVTSLSSNLSAGIHQTGGEIFVGWGRTYFISLNFNFTKDVE